MAARLQLRVVRTVLDAIETLIGELWPLFRIYVVPWLAWTLAVIALDRYWVYHYGTGVAPDYLIALSFAPFEALIAVGVLRWITQPHDEFVLFRFDQTLAWATALFAIIGLATYAVGQAVVAWLMANPGLIATGPLADSSLGQRLVWFAVAILPTWLATLLVYLLAMPQAAVIVSRGRLDFPRQWQLLRLAPLAVLAVAIVIGICRLGFSFGYSNLLFRVVSWDGPLADVTFGWRRDLAVGLWRSLIALPAQFLTDALALVALARVYKALAGYADRTGRSD